MATQAGLALVGAPARSRDDRHARQQDPRLHHAVSAARRPLALRLDAQGVRPRQDRLGALPGRSGDAQLELIYNDPATADFEPRPVLARRPPMVRVGRGRTRMPTADASSAHRCLPPERRTCRSAAGWFAWWKGCRWSGGTARTRISGRSGRTTTACSHACWAPCRWPPTARSRVEVPADRLMHFQVLDSDRRVVGNQLTWIYPRAGETKSCIGCHENPHTTPRRQRPLALRYPPVKFLPNGDEFNYRAKAWMKGYLPPEVEERMRTVRAVNLLGR